MKTKRTAVITVAFKLDEEEMEKLFGKEGMTDIDLVNAFTLTLNSHYTQKTNPLVGGFEISWVKQVSYTTMGKDH